MKKNRPSPPPQIPKADSQRLLPLALGVFILVLVAFWTATNNGFINYDDPDYVTKNEHVQHGLTWDSVKWAFGSTSDATNWHPITWISHMLDFTLFGQNPHGHHGTSVVLHALNAALLLLLLARLTGKIWRSFAVAVLFGLHPLRVESVAWVSERKDVLSAFFFLLAIYAYVRWRQRNGDPPSADPQAARAVKENIFLHLLPHPAWYLLALFFSVLGLMSKPMLVTLPFVLLLLDYWPLRRFERYKVFILAAEKIPFLLLAIPVAAVTLVVQKSGGAMSHNVPLALRLQTAVISYMRYLGKMFWPAGLSIEYPYPQHWPLPTLFSAIALVAGISFLAFYSRRSCPFFITGWLWYLGMLVPVIGIVQVGVQSMADRYTYLPCIGVIIILAWGAGECSAKWPRRQWILGAVTSAAAASCIVVTQHQIAFWKDSRTFFERALEVNDRNKIALICLADFDRDEHRYPEAMELYRKAIAIDPRMEQAQLNLGVVLYTTGQRDAAIAQLEQALNILPDSALLHGNLGIFLTNMKRLDEATAHLEIAVREKPDYAEAHVVLGDIYLNTGRRDDALAQYRAALAARPHFAPAEQRLQSL